jgi:hypothetical protein
MYFGVIVLNNTLKQDRILCKIGYSFDIAGRIKDLENDYDCKFHLLGLKLVNSQSDEKAFHKLLKMHYPEFIVNSIQVKTKTIYPEEIYVFDKYLYKEFLSYVDKVKFSDEEIKMDEESQRIIDNHFEMDEKLFQNDSMIPVTDEEQPQRKKRKLNTI